MSSNKRKLLLCSATLILPLLLAGCGAGYGSGQQAEFGGTKAHDLGVYHFGKGHYGLAIQHFEKATKKGESMVESLNGLGASYDQLGRFDIAESYYRRALRLDPQSAQTLNNMGYSYWMQEKYDLALAFLRDADKLDRGNRLIAANRALASASLEEKGGAMAIDQLAALEEATAAVEDPAFNGKHGARLERTTAYEQHLVLQPEAIPAAFAGLPDTITIAPHGQVVTEIEDDGSLTLPLSYLADQTALQLPGDDASAVTRGRDGSAGPSAATEEPVLERNQMARVPLVAVEAAALPVLTTAAGPDAVPETAFETVGLDEVRGFDAAFAPETPAGLALDGETETFVAESPYAAAPSREAPAIDVATPVAVAAASEPVAEDEATGFLDSLLAGIKFFFTGGAPQNDVVVASAGPTRTLAAAPETEGYVGPYGTEAGGRHHSLGLVRPDQYAVSHPKIEVSDVSGQVGTAARVGSYLQERGLPVEQGASAAEPAQPAANRLVTTIYSGEGWDVYASGLAATLPTEVELRRDIRQGADIRIEVGADLVEFDRDATAEDTSRRDDITG
ncbi:MAG TPA: tetratricopeptide repeat protein [Kiloniellaceae bacterium]|nr:tetratricopeptide repeat protein [Kiloniellaceae bacterium]